MLNFFNIAYIKKTMKNILLTFVIALGLSKTTNAQGVITAVPCDMLGMSINVGSQETASSVRFQMVPAQAGSGSGGVTTIK